MANQPPSSNRPGMRPTGRRSTGAPARGGFTLIEVILAISLAVGLLIAALLFYRQATDTRRQILAESEKLSTVRLVMQRIADDLRTTAFPGTTRAFEGHGNAMSFEKAVMIPPARTRDLEIPPPTRIRVLYSALRSMEGTNRSVVGLHRSEIPVGTVASRSQFDPSVEPTSTGLAVPDRDGISEITSTNRPPEPLTDAIRFIRFRYWGTDHWEDSWTNSRPPAGVEIHLGMEPLPDDSVPEAYPFEVFRRVVLIPAAGSNPTIMPDPMAGDRSIGSP